MLGVGPCVEIGAPQNGWFPGGFPLKQAPKVWGNSFPLTGRHWSDYDWIHNWRGTATLSGTMEFDSCHAAGNGGAVLAARSFKEGATREQSVPNSAKLRHLAVAFLEGFPLKPTTTRRTPVFPWPLRSGRRRVKFRIANGLFCPPSSGKALQFGTPMRVSIDGETKKKTFQGP